ncbi:hypothetical protein FF1_028065 [Malus domestica]
MGVLVIATLGVGLQTHRGVCGWESDFWEWKSHPVISLRHFCFPPSHLFQTLFLPTLRLSQPSPSSPSP